MITNKASQSKKKIKKKETKIGWTVILQNLVSYDRENEQCAMLPIVNIWLWDLWFDGPDNRSLGGRCLKILLDWKIQTLESFVNDRQ